MLRAYLFVLWLFCYGLRLNVLFIFYCCPNIVYYLCHWAVFTVLFMLPVYSMSSKIGDEWRLHLRPIHTWPSAVRLRYISRRRHLAARVLNARMPRVPRMAQLRAACGWISHSSGPCGKVGFFLLSRWNRAARWCVPMVTVDGLQFVVVHSRGCFDSVYDSQLWMLELVFVKVMCKIRYRRIVRLLKQVSSIQFVKLNTSMEDNRFGGVFLKQSRIGSVDTRIQLSWKGRLGRIKIFIHQMHLQLVYFCMVVKYAYIYCHLFSSLPNLHLLYQHFQLWLSWLVVSLHHYFPEEVLTCLHLQVKSNESSPLSQK